ncbi:MAG TPA: Fe-S cluster assembly protein SufD [Miltoncostaeaceae bacterium]|nr:Fe-S cluster assembly protein SufD [Miltoncostaeaceae bacterium]
MGSAPAWADAARAAAAERLAALPPLTGQEEEWRFTPPTDLALEGPEPEAAGDGFGPLAAEVADDRSAELMSVDGAEPTVGRAGLPDGVVVDDLAEALATHEALVRERLYSLVGFEGKPGALNAARWESGTFVYVPRGVEVELPVEALLVASGGRGRVFGRTLVIVDEGAKATVIDRFSSPDLPGTAQASSVAELFVAQGGELEHVAVIDWGAGVRHHAIVAAHVGRDAQARSVVITLGGDVVRVEPTLHCAGPGADGRALGLYLAAGHQHFEHRVISRHEAPNAYSNLLYKGAIKDAAHTVFFGNLVVPPGAPGTDAYQTNRNLVLNEGARADTIPFLEIETAEVRCSHAGAVGRVDDEHLFYLRSRGVPEAVAKQLIVEGFFQEVLDEIRLEELRGVLSEAIAAKVAT